MIFQKQLNNKNFPALIIFPSLIGKFNWFFIKKKPHTSMFLYHVNNLYNTYLFSFNNWKRKIKHIDTITPYFLSSIDENRMSINIPIDKFSINQHINNIDRKKLIIINTTDIATNEENTIDGRNVKLPHLLSLLTFIRYYEEDDYRKIIKQVKERGGCEKYLMRFYFFNNFFNLNWKNNYDRELQNINRERYKEYECRKIESRKSEYLLSAFSFIKSVIFN